MLYIGRAQETTTISLLGGSQQLNLAHVVLHSFFQLSPDTLLYLYCIFLVLGLTYPSLTVQKWHKHMSNFFVALCARCMTCSWREKNGCNCCKRFAQSFRTAFEIHLLYLSCIMKTLPSPNTNLIVSILLYLTLKPRFAWDLSPGFCFPLLFKLKFLFSSAIINIKTILHRGLEMPLQRAERWFYLDGYAFFFFFIKFLPYHTYWYSVLSLPSWNFYHIIY